MNNSAVILALAFGLVVFAVLIYFLGRTGRQLNNLKRQYDRPPLLQNHEHWKRDSTLIAFAVAAKQNDYMAWYEERHDQKMMRITPADVTVGEILYSPHELHMVGLVGYPQERNQKANHYDNRPIDHIGNAVVGFRDSLNDPWSMYGLETITLYGYDSPHEAVVGARISYFETVTGQTAIHVGEDAMGTAELFNLNDERFWTSDLWKVGARSQGVYPFQVRLGPTNRTPRWIPVKPLVDNYPDWVHEMYSTVEEE